MTYAMAKDFESRFFDLLQENVNELRAEIRRVGKKVDQNTALTEAVKAQAEKTNGRVDKLETKVFKKQGRFSFTNDKQLLTVFATVLLLFLLILASVLGVKVPSL